MTRIGKCLVMQEFNLVTFDFKRRMTTMVPVIHLGKVNDAWTWNSESAVNIKPLLPTHNMHPGKLLPLHNFGPNGPLPLVFSSGYGARYNSSKIHIPVKKRVSSGCILVTSQQLGTEQWRTFKKVLSSQLLSKFPDISEVWWLVCNIERVLSDSFLEPEVQ